MKRQSKQRTSQPNARAWAATLLIAGASLLPTMALLTQLDTVRAVRATSRDEVTVFEERWAPLKAAVQGQVEVGYFWPAAATPLTATEAAHLYLSQYSLAPILLVNDPTSSLVIADPAFRPDRGPFILPRDFDIVRDFGNGLFLLKPIR